jgi:hypothetical protein
MTPAYKDETGGGNNKPCLIYLINMKGEVVHTWSIKYAPIQAKLLTNGHIVVMGQYSNPILRLRPGWGRWWMGGAAGNLEEYDWGGKRVFSHIDIRMHHDFVKLENGHYIYLDWERVPHTLSNKVKGGIQFTEHVGGWMFNDHLVEIDEKGRKVWEWHANQHLDPAIDIIGPFFKRQEWCHANAIDVLANGDLLLTSRSLDSLLVINKASGKITFRWGSPSRLDAASRGVTNRTNINSLGGPHGRSVIPKGYPGAGNFLCFSNRTTDGDFMFSRPVEIDPTAGYAVWHPPTSGGGRKMFSDFVGGAQRLANGNTLVCDGANGHMYQITANDEIVWEYISPYIPSRFMSGAVFNAHSYAPDFCPQFKSLKPAGGAAILPPDPADTVLTARRTTATADTGPPSWAIAAAALLCISLLLNIYFARKVMKGRTQSFPES